MLRVPNQEQKLAIEHQGGVLLSAGAGAGKTFVLVEHAFFLVKSFFDKKSFSHPSDCENQLRDYFSKIVYMTFTKKAAGELSIRLKDRFELELISAQKKESYLKEWQALAAFKALNALNVTTIHGFCFKLLQRGYFPGISLDQEIIGEIELREKVESLVMRWLSLEEESIRLDKDTREALILNQDSLCDSFVSVFMSPEIRLLWRDLDVNKYDSNNDSELLKRIGSLLNLQYIQENCPDFEDFETKKRPKWSERGLELFSQIQRADLNSYKGILELGAYFNDFGRMPPIQKSKVSADVYHFYQKVKLLKNFIKEYQEDFEAFIENKSTAFLSWSKSIKNLYHFIEKNYRMTPGLTFSDLEYFVLTGLNDEKIREKISLDYNYLVVDEFQDTSEIQFEILNKIVKGNFSRLFCVGDIKQAIYGFRGGELGVFKRCSNSSLRSLNLSNNYRSCEKIIKFNNSLFGNIFPKGAHFEGRDQYTVPVASQNCIEQEQLSGSIEKYKIEVLTSQETKSLNSSELDWIESNCIVNLIEENIQKEYSDTCVLYKKLTPLRFLFPILMERKLSFTCQMKVKLDEDPLLCLFFNLLTPFVEENFLETKHQCTQLMRVFIEILGGSFNRSNLKVDNFYENISILGLWESFKKLLFDLNIHNSNYPNNLNLIRSFCLIGEDNCLGILKKVKLSSGNYSIELQIGGMPQKVKIMTAHASKGLEFSHVILGGIHTNGSSKSEVSFFGKLPLSFKWRAGIEKKKAFRSPEFIYENLLTKKKNFAESKRLLYVACTRAKESLAWFDINLNGTPQVFSKDSWVNGVRSWEKDQSLEGRNKEEVVSIDLKKFEINKNWENETIIRKGHQTPLFHQNSLGVQLRPESYQVEMITSSELSVTNLALLAECPRKFYFRNILKISPIEDWDEERKALSLGSERVFRDEENLDEVNSRPLSSLERGTLIHKSLSYALKNNFEQPEELESIKDTKAINWVLKQLKPYRKTHELISEEIIKFPFFNFMISGTPDLVMLSKDSSDLSEIWDFKTGKGSLIAMPSYWFQLMSYAYAFYRLEKIDYSKKVRLVLCFLDKKCNEEKKLSFPEISDALYQEWKKTDFLGRMNREFCPTCPYGNLCHPN